MPKPLPNESKSDYVSRCIEYVVKNEGVEQKAAIGKCYGLWEHFHKNNVTEKIDVFLEQGTITPDIDVTITDSKPKKKKKSPFRRRLQSGILGI